MKHILKYKLFESNETFPDVFGDSLLRGVKNMSVSEYIDDPSKRNIRIGTDENDAYRSFLENYKLLGLQDPTKSVHFYVNPDGNSQLSHFGKTFRVIPESNSKFSFSREIRNGGLGSTWYFFERCLKDCDIDIDIFSKYINIEEHIRGYDGLEELFYNDRIKFKQFINEYQNILIENDIVGNITYNELIELTKSKSETMQIWTESRCLLKSLY